MDCTIAEVGDDLDFTDYYTAEQSCASVIVSGRLLVDGRDILAELDGLRRDLDAYRHDAIVQAMGPRLDRHLRVHIADLVVGRTSG